MPTTHPYPLKEQDKLIARDINKQNVLAMLNPCQGTLDLGSLNYMTFDAIVQTIKPMARTKEKCIFKKIVTCIRFKRYFVKLALMNIKGNKQIGIETWCPRGSSCKD